MELHAKKLTKTYGKRTVVEGIDIDIVPGKILGLLGPNGAGKTTIIKMLSGQISPTSGDINIDGESYSSVPSNLRGKIGVMPQEVIIWDYLNVKENLEFTGKNQGLKGDDLKKRVDNLIEALNLRKELNTLGKNLSGGFKRRLNLAISIIHEPSLIFLDEPTPGIDPQNRRFLWEFINSFKGSDKYSVVLTDHYLDEAEKLSDYVVIIDNGKIIAQGTVEELKKQYSGERILKIFFDEEDASKNVSQLDNSISKIKNEYPQTHLNKNIITVTGKDLVNAISQILDILKEDNLHPKDISISESTLEDVFLILTGKTIRE